MNFWIQAGTPRVAAGFNAEDETICEAAETVFALDSEQAFLNWNGVYAPMSYKYDIGVMANDIVRMVRSLRENHSGKLWVEWPSNTFAARWELTWEGDRLHIHAEWRSVTGHTEPLLRERCDLETLKENFRCEWKMVLSRLLQGLGQSGYSADNLPEIMGVQCEIDEMPSSGRLYV